ncbi:Adenylate cyclase type 1 [Camelus dromedarius]|uniref:Adenylate cyclase type 1 n=1 Tax=Camelus dromedarius TaxID=9838 RepID=A0A5N4ECT0_CAMDR|nr:Adenylate cyclase type 1 [Camelus dromedarius]
MGSSPDTIVASLGLGPGTWVGQGRKGGAPGILWAHLTWPSLQGLCVICPRGVTVLLLLEFYVCFLVSCVCTCTSPGPGRLTIQIRNVLCIFTVVLIYSVAPGCVGGSGSGGIFQLITAILLSSCALALHAWQLDVRLRLDYVLASQEQGREERDNVERVKLDNKRVLFNLLPAHVTQHFLMSSPRNTVLYCQSCSQVGVMLTSIPKFNDFYIQLDDSNVGVRVCAPE